MMKNKGGFLFFFSSKVELIGHPYQISLTQIRDSPKFIECFILIKHQRKMGAITSILDTLLNQLLELYSFLTKRMTFNTFSLWVLYGSSSISVLYSMALCNLLEGRQNNDLWKFLEYAIISVLCSSSALIEVPQQIHLEAFCYGFVNNLLIIIGVLVTSVFSEHDMLLWTLCSGKYIF